MRRNDRKINDIEEIESIIEKSNVCRVALSENNSPYIVPVCFGYKDNCLYFHSAMEGKKIDIIKKNNNICFEFDIHGGLLKSEKPCDWDIEYSSVIGFGKASFINGFNEKIKALKIIIEHYSKNSYDFQKKFIDNVTIIKVETENIFGKRSGYL
ncbi:MAG: pyridoxamine 5'-phosphate oxidase family protein [Candidatus Methanoperedens sp.]|nr:pyridoxamine 5'-phosphate oxidase family protein [Candidatus Methanoperedens sp.]